MVRRRVPSFPLSLPRMRLAFNAFVIGTTGNREPPRYSADQMFVSRRALLFLPITFFFIACARSGTPPARQAPNVILVSVDTLRFDATSLDSWSRNSTPVLANLAKVGVMGDAEFAAEARAREDREARERFRSLGYLH